MAPKTKSVNACKRQPIEKLQKASEADAHGCPQKFKAAEKRAVMCLARERHAGQTSESKIPVNRSTVCACSQSVHWGVHAVSLETRALEAWRLPRRPCRCKTVHAAKVPSDACSATPLYQVDLARHIDELRQAFTEQSSHPEVAQLMDSIKSSTKSLKSGLASLCDRATLNLDMIDLLTQSVESQSESAHYLLLAWMQELQLMRNQMMQRDQEQQNDNQLAQVSVAVENCLRSTSILSKVCQDQGNVRTESHVLIKILKLIQEKGLDSLSDGNDCIDFSFEKSGSQAFEHDFLLRSLNALKDHGIPREERTALSMQSSCSKDPEHEIDSECTALIGAAINNQEHGILPGDVGTPVSMTSCKTYPEHEDAESKLQSSCNERGSPLQPSTCAKQDFSIAPASHDLADQRDGQNDLAAPDMAAFKVMPPKSRPLSKLRPSPLSQISKREQEGPSATTTNTTQLDSFASPTGTTYWTLDKEKLASAHLGDDSCKHVHETDSRQASKSVSRRGSPLGRRSGHQGRPITTKGYFSPEGSLSPPVSRPSSCTRGRRISIQKCLSPGASRQGSLSQRGAMCFSPEGSMSPAASREPSRRRGREALPMIALVRATALVINVEEDHKLPALRDRRASAPM